MRYCREEEESEAMRQLGVYCTTQFYLNVPVTLQLSLISDKGGSVRYPRVNSCGFLHAFRGETCEKYDEHVHMRAYINADIALKQVYSYILS